MTDGDAGATLITKIEIAATIPHAGSMCLLDGVIRWDSNSIRCISGTHKDASNPLRSGGRLATVCGVEYAAQAMAVHGRLIGSVEQPLQLGYLASLRNLDWRCEYLDHLSGDLIIAAMMVISDNQSVIYQFDLRCEADEVLSGRATIVWSPIAK